MNKKQIIIVSSILLFIVVTMFSFLFYVRSFTIIKTPPSLTSEENNILMEACENKFQTKVLSYPNFVTEHGEYFPDTQPQIFTRSCILADNATGAILFEKNADELIPPASMTKLVGMYIVFSEIEKGAISFDDIVPLPPESWWINAPARSSLMFLEEGQRVTLHDLLLGSAVMSGNDAAVAIANYVAGSTENFIAKMNEVVNQLGMTHTHFDDASGYSEKNLTTARDYLKFTRIYLEKFPYAIERFHSHQEFTFNGVAHKSTNRLLGKIDGVDGIKTGYIDESGYNIALTAKRNDTRFIAIMMGGPGANAAEGNRYRIIDATNLLDWAFKNYRTVLPDYYSFTIPVFEGKEKFLRVVPSNYNFFTSPILQNSENKITTQYSMPKYITSQISVAQNIGEMNFYCDDVKIGSVYLVAEKSIAKSSKIKCALDKLAQISYNALY